VPLSGTSCSCCRQRRSCLLLVRHAGHDHGWGILGGAVEMGESPAGTAVREARHEISADTQLVHLLDVRGSLWPYRAERTPNWTAAELPLLSEDGDE
jgi:ADP-ribose pyrophosphatase YjhB (NUDIX family)